MKLLNLILIISIISIKTSFAVNIKSGEVLGPDGKVYKGASPEQKEKIIYFLSKKDKPVDIINNNLMILHEDNLISIPLIELSGKSDKKIDEIIDGEFSKVDDKVSKKNKFKINQNLNSDIKALSKNKTKAISKNVAKSAAKNVAKSAAKKAAKSSSKGGKGDKGDGKK